MMAASRKASQKRFFFAGSALVLIALSFIVASFSARISFLPWQWTPEEASKQSDRPIAGEAEVSPDHVHVGDVFTITVYLSVRPGTIQAQEPDASGLLPSHDPFDLLRMERKEESFGAVTRYRYRYYLQAVDVLPGKRYTMKFTRIPYTANGSAKVFLLPSQDIDIVPRFFANNPIPSPPRGEISERFVLIVLRICAALLLCASAALGFATVKRKKRMQPPLKPKERLLAQHRELAPAGRRNVREFFFAMENLATLAGQEKGYSNLDMWRGKFPSLPPTDAMRAEEWEAFWKGASSPATANEWQEFWNIVASAYAQVPAGRREAQKAYDLLGRILERLIGEEKK